MPPIARSQRARRGLAEGRRPLPLSPDDLTEFERVLLAAGLQGEGRGEGVGLAILRDDRPGVRMLIEEAFQQGFRRIRISAVSSHRDRDPVHGVARFPEPIRRPIVVGCS